MKIALDTNAYRAFVDGDQIVVSTVQRATNIGFPVIVLGELRAGFLNGTRRVENEQILSRVLSSERVEVLEATSRTSAEYAAIWSELRKKGTPIPTNDVWIAAQCREQGFALLTLDRHFQSISGLHLLG